MSQVKVSGNASGTGIFEIAAPNSSTNRTLTLPDNTGTLISTGTVGTILSVTTATTTASFSTSSSSYVDSGFSISVTPTSATSNLIILCTGCMSNAGTTAVTDIGITDSSNTLLNSAQAFVRTLGTAGGSAQAGVPYAIQTVVAAASTSTRSYKIRVKVAGSTGGFPGSPFAQSITVFEVAA